MDGRTDDRMVMRYDAKELFVGIPIGYEFAYTYKYRFILFYKRTFHMPFGRPPSHSVRTGRTRRNEQRIYDARSANNRHQTHCPSAMSHAQTAKHVHTRLRYERKLIFMSGYMCYYDSL